MSQSSQEHHVDREYLSLVKDVLAQGNLREDRTGTGTVSLFGAQKRYDLRAGFPLLTTKRVYPRGVFGELIFFLQGQTNNQWLRERNIHIWDEWAAEDGDLGPIYGAQWRRWTGAPEGQGDQMRTLLTSLRDQPFSRRHIVSSWNVTALESMALPPCHTMFQFYVTPDAQGKPWGLSCQLYQRSADILLGVPFNIASYAALTQLVAELLGLQPLEFVHTMGDAHIYSNHREQIDLQLSRESELYPMCTMTIEHPVNPGAVDLNDPAVFDTYEPESFVLHDYKSHPAIKAPVAV